MKVFFTKLETGGYLMTITNDKDKPLTAFYFYTEDKIKEALEYLEPILDIEKLEALSDKVVYY